MPHSVTLLLPEVIKKLQSVRLTLTDEKKTQEQLATVLGASCQREVNLADGDIIDFVVGRIGIELKIKGGKRAIYRQIKRYCLSERLDAVILLSAVAMGLPSQIEGKPVHVVSLGRAWL